MCSSKYIVSFFKAVTEILAYNKTQTISATTTTTTTARGKFPLQLIYSNTVVMPSVSPVKRPLTYRHEVAVRISLNCILRSADTTINDHDEASLTMNYTGLKGCVSLSTTRVNKTVPRHHDTTRSEEIRSAD